VPGDGAAVDFAGREDELARLRKLVERAIAGNGGIVFISGEAGSGKTRLVKELVEWARGKDLVFIQGRCLYQEGADPYLPFLDAFRDYFRTAQTAPPADGEERGTQSGEMLPLSLMGMGIEDTHGKGAADRVRATDIGKERDKMYEEVSTALRRIAAGKPLLFFLDDLQWADSATIQLLVFVVRGLKGSRILIAAGYRPEELTEAHGRPHPLTDAFTKIRREAIVETIELKRLGLDDTRKLLMGLLGRKELPEGFAEKIHGQTDGNPYFIEELVKALTEQGVLDPSDPTGPLKKGWDEVTVPSSVKSVIDQRIARLDPDAAKVLEYSSVIGQEFTLDMLRGISEMKEEDLVDALDRLVRSQLVIEDSGGIKLRFTHNMLREAVYGGISRSRKRILHRKVADAIEAAHQNKLEEQTFLLAHHYAAAGDLAKCAKYFLHAGRKALGSLALDEAGYFYRSALESLRKLEPSPENLSIEEEVLLALGSVDFNLGEWDRALAEFREVGELGKEWGNERITALSELRIGEIFEKRSEWKDASENYTAALEIFQRAGDEGGLARVYTAMGKVFWRRGEYAKALEHSGKGRALAEKLGEKSLAATATIDTGNVYFDLGEFEKSRKQHEEGLAKATEIDDPLEMARAFNNLGNVEMKLEHYDQAIALFEKTAEAGYRSGNIRIVGFALSSIGECIGRKGNVEKAMDYLDQSMTIFEKLNERLMISSNLAARGIIYRNAENWEMARKSFQESIRVIEGLNMPFNMAERLLDFGIACRIQGARKQAHELIAKALRIYEELGAKNGIEKAQAELKETGDTV
jgi:tetratricopeptide (TPR) repeat protein